MAETKKQISSDKGKDSERRKKLQTLHAHDQESSAREKAVGAHMKDGTVFAGISPDTNQPMYAAPKDEPMLLAFGRAAARAEEVSQSTGKAYRVPSDKELNVLFNNCVAIGGFNLTGLKPEGWYWSSTPLYTAHGRCQSFSDGYQHLDALRSRVFSVRLVRS